MQVLMIPGFATVCSDDRFAMIFILAAFAYTKNPEVDNDIVFIQSSDLLDTLIEVREVIHLGQVIKLS